MQIIKELSRYIVGLIFILSGLVKINDPVGTQIKLTEYFDVFASDIHPFFSEFIPYALFLSVFLSVLEVVLGGATLFGYRMKWTSYTLLFIIVFFTFLTFYSAYYNKVTDCGCFGDAIKLTPWQSFFKDIVLLVLISILIWNRNTYNLWFGGWLKGYFVDIKMIGIALFSTLCAWYAIEHLPFVDFRTYKVGNHLPTLMKNSEPLKYVYVMERDGEQYLFETYPSDTNYKYIESRLTNPDAIAKITDLTIWEGDIDYTEDILSGTKLILIFHQIEDSDVHFMNDLRNLLEDNSWVEAIMITSSNYASFEVFRHKYQLGAPYYFADATVLKTMVRSNPGILLIKEGEILGKWHINDTPTLDQVIEIIKRN